MFLGGVYSLFEFDFEAIKHVLMMDKNKKLSPFIQKFEDVSNERLYFHLC